MSRIVNLKTIRFKLFNVFDSWHTQWFEKKQYQSVLYEDLAVRSYLVGIFYRLKVPTNYFFIKRLGSNDIFIHTDLFFMKYFKKSKLRNLFVEQRKYFSYLLKLYVFFYNYFFTHTLTNREYYRDYFFSEKGLKQIGFIGLLNNQKLFNALGRYFDDSELINRTTEILPYNKHNNINNLLYPANVLNDFFLMLPSKNTKLLYDKYFISNIRLVLLFYNKYITGKLFNSCIVPIKGISTLLYDQYITLLLKTCVYFFSKLKYIPLRVLKYILQIQFVLKYNYLVLRNKQTSLFYNYYVFFKNSNRKIKNNLYNKKMNCLYLPTITNIPQNNLFFLYWYNTNLIHSNILSYYKTLSSVLYYGVIRNKVNLVLNVLDTMYHIDSLIHKHKFYRSVIQIAIKRQNTDKVNYISHSLHFKKYFSIIKYIKGRYYRYSTMFVQGNYSKKLVRKRLFHDFFSKFFNQFIIKIEETLRSYTKQNVYFLCNYYYMEKDFPEITNAKIICDYIVYQIHSNMRLKSIFYKIRRWQLVNNEHKKYLENQFFTNRLGGKLEPYLEHLSFKRYPIMGIRIECSGTSKKGTRKRKIFYGDWIKDFDLISKSPNNTFSADLDYYQSFAIVKSCSLGVKVWVFFKTHLYNNNNEFISLLSY
jgi:hypothetical protein